MTKTQSLIAVLRQRAERGRWSITTDELADRYDPVGLYRAAYAVSLLGVDRYDAENVGELLELLTVLSGHDYRAEFRAAGLYLSQDDRFDLTERFVRVVRRAIVLHTPEPETFRSMLRALRRYDRARLVYEQTFLDLDQLAGRCADEYAELRELPGCGLDSVLRATVVDYLHLLVRRHLIDLEELAPALFELLRTIARHEGMLPGGRASEESSPDPSEAQDERAQALRVLQLPVAATRAEIRESYRRLMRLYHPDINPEGLEHAKRITVAYALLAADSGDA